MLYYDCLRKKKYNLLSKTHVLLLDECRKNLPLVAMSQNAMSCGAPSIYKHKTRIITIYIVDAHGLITLSYNNDFSLYNFENYTPLKQDRGGLYLIKD